MVTPHLPGFCDPVHDAQRTFRALLDALARPGISHTTASVTPPPGLTTSCAAAALTLLDLETSVWLQAHCSEDIKSADIKSWLLFHTGCRFTDNPQQADFALIWTVSHGLSLQDFNWGTPEYPEASTSLLIQCPSLHGGNAITLQGPGILGEMTVDVSLSHSFWQQWQQMTRHYPLGVDAWCFADNRVMGLPRTSHCLNPISID